jgi:hypothetical protein
VPAHQSIYALTASTPICSGFTISQIGGIWGMPALTRRRDHNRPQECWLIFYGDVHAGTIAECVGNPGAAPKWQWRCGFYPGSRPAECSGGTAATFDTAREAFEAAWRVFMSKRTEADFQEWREQQVWTAEKYRRFDRGERMPADWRPG